LTVKLSNYPAHNAEEHVGRGSYSTYGTGITGATGITGDSQYSEGGLESRAAGSYAISPLSAYSANESPLREGETPGSAGADRQSRGQAGRVKDDLALEGIQEE
jgi:hypothetical protein